jgi:hypothetical protein
MRRKCAFTLVELLVAAMIVAAAGGGAVSALYAFFNLIWRLEDMATAYQRGEMVFSILERAIFHAGLGMPYEVSEFQNAFKINATYPKVASWDGPVSVKNGRLRLVYAVSTSCAAKGPYDVTSDTLIRAQFEKDLPLDQVLAGKGNANNLKSWVTFTTLGQPFFVERIIDSKTLDLKSSKASRIAKNDKLCLVRAIEAYAGFGFFYMEDVTVGSGYQPVVEGVAGAWFEYDNDRGILTVALLCRGAKRYNREVTAKKPPLWEAEISGEDRHYRLIATKKTWRIRN